MKREARSYKVVDRIAVTIDGRRWEVELRLGLNTQARGRLLALARQAIRNHSRRRQLAGGLFTFVAVESPEKQEEGCDSQSPPPSP